MTTHLSRGAKFAQRTARLRASTIREMLKVTQQPDIISFGGGLPAPELFPTREIAECTTEVMESYGAAALQYVRKVSGFTKPSQANVEAFERAVDAVSEISARLLDELVTNAPPKDREVEAAKARARAAERYAA